jgi:hypothetical protein
MEGTKTEAWKTMDDTQLETYSKNESAAICQSSEWEGIPLERLEVEKQTFEHYKKLRDGK